MEEKLNPASPGVNRGGIVSPWITDIIVLLVFLSFAALFHIGRRGTVQEILDLKGDAANIASFAAALDHPGLFDGDMVLNDPKNFKFYATFHIPLLRLLHRVMNHYGNAFVTLVGPHVFLHLAGFYLFGVVLLGSRFWAFALAWALLSNFGIGLGDFWGIFQDPIPRVSFSALLGFLWAAALYWRKQPFAWPWVMAAAGLMMYVHPVSAPAIALAVWIGLWRHKPEQWPEGKRFWYMLFCGLCFLVVAGPFILNYLTIHEHGVVAYAKQVRSIMESRFIRGYMTNQLWAIKNFLRSYSWNTPLIPLGILGTLFIALAGNRDEREILSTLLLWATGIAIVAIGLFLLDHKFARFTGRIPVQVDLIRNIRFFIPLSLILFVWGLVTIERRIERSIGSRLVLAGFFVFAIIMSKAAPTYLATPKNGVKILLHRVGTTEVSTQSGAIMAIGKFTPPKAKILSYGIGALPIRYGALRPVVYSYKDGGAFAYANHAALLRWHEVEKPYREIAQSKDPRNRLTLLLQMAKTLDAEYLAIDHHEVSPDFLPVSDNIIWSNRDFSLIRLSSG